MQNFGALGVGETSQAATFTVSNEGEGSTGAITVTLSGSDFAIAADNCAEADLATEETCTIDVTFTPSAEGAASGSLDVEAENGGDASATLEGSGAAGSIAISPTPHDFGSVAVGETSTTMDFTVSNGGGAETGEITATLSGGAATEFTVTADDCTGSTLAVDATCTITAQFAPTSAGMKSTTISVVTDGNDGEASAALTGTAVDPAELSITPLTQNFGDITVGNTSSDVTFTVTNDGGVASGAVTAALGGANAADFGVVTNTCDGADLDGGDSCQIVVNFAPGTAGAKTASLDVSAAAADAVSAALSGNGADAPGLSITPSPADFGTATVGTTGNTVSLTVENTGGADTGALNTTFAGTNPGDFTFVAGANGCQGVALAAGDTCTIAVAFAPAATGNRTADLRVSGNPGGSATATLNGVGEMAPANAQFSITPSSNNYGSVQVGGQSNTVTFTVENIGGQTSASPVVTITGDFSQFNKVGDNCTAPLDPTETCTIDIRFEPSNQGDKQATLTVAGAAGNSATATLQGAAITPADLQANPTSLGFGQVIIGGQSNTASVVITNNGSQTTGAITTTLGGDFTIVNDQCDGNTLAMGDNCTITVRFTPQTLGTVSENLNITANPGAPAPGLNVGLNGDGEPAFLVSPAAPDPYDFGDVPVGSAAATQRFTIENNQGVGERDRAISVDITNTEFPFTTPTVNMVPGCDGSIIAPGDSCGLTVGFEPTSVAAQTATIDITDAQNITGTRNLAGNGVGPLQITPDPYDFGTVNVGQTVTQTFTITNNDDTNLSGTLNTEFDGGTNFGIVFDNCAGQILAPNGSCTFQLVFYPSAQGQVSGTYTVSSQTGLGDTLDFTGTGGGVPNIEVTGNGDFGDVIATNSTTQTFTITNTGGATSPELVFAVFSSQTFSITSSTCALLTKLAPNDSCDVTITAKPGRHSPLGSIDGTFIVQLIGPGFFFSDTYDLTVNNQSMLSISPDPGVFPDTIAGETSAPVTFTVTNNGTEDVDSPAVDAFAVPAVGGSFDVDTNGCGTIPAGGTCDILVTFSPNVPADFEGLLDISGSETVTDQVIHLTADTNQQFYGWFVNTINAASSKGLRAPVPGTLTIDAPNETFTDNGFGTLTGDQGGSGFVNYSTGEWQIFLNADAPNSQDITASYTSSGPGDNVEADLQGTGLTNALVEFDRNYPDLGEAVEGQTGVSRTFTLRNNGDQSSGTLDTTLTGDDTEFTVTDNCDGQDLAPGATCTYVVTFEPGAGTAVATYSIDIDIDAPNSPNPSLTVSGRSLNEDNLEITPGGFVFADTVEGLTSATQTFTVRNRSSNTTNALSPISVANGDTGSFTISNDNCDGTTLPANNTCTFDVTFEPTTFGWLSADVRANTGGIQAGVARVAGYGLQEAGLEFLASEDTDDLSKTTPNPFRFEDTAETTSRDATLRLRNNGDQDSGAITLALSGVSAVQYSIVNDNCSAGVAGGEICTFDLRFSPTNVSTPDTFDATITATPSNGSDDSSTIEGEGVTAPALDIQQDTYDCGQVVATTSALCAETVTIENTGAVPTGDLTLSLSNQNEFEIVGGSCLDDPDDDGDEEPLGPASSCTVIVRYTPTTVSTLDSTDLTVSATPGGSDTATLEADSVSSLSDDQGGDASFSAQVALSDTLLITITNASGAETTGPLSVFLEGANADEWSIINSNAGGSNYSYCAGQVLDDEDSCEVELEFIPKTIGAGKTATLRVTDGEVTQEVVVDLTGEGTAL